MLYYSLMKIIIFYFYNFRFKSFKINQASKLFIARKLSILFLHIGHSLLTLKKLFSFLWLYYSAQSLHKQTCLQGNIATVAVSAMHILH